MHSHLPVRRISPHVALVENRFGLDIRLFANDSVSLEKDAFSQLLEFASLAGTLEDIQSRPEQPGCCGFFGEAGARIERIVLTPDFHRGSGIPVGTVFDARGFVVPRAIGNDIGCGMRLYATDLPAEALEPHWKAITTRLRHLFFHGGRDIPMSPLQREALLREGLPGLLSVASPNASRGLWRRVRPRGEEDEIARMFHGGGFSARGLFGFDALVRSSGREDGRDPQIGSVGGGNHFVELQRVEEIVDGATAMAWGLRRGTLAIMVHSGSVGLGHAVGGHFMDLAHRIFPGAVPHPAHGFYVLPTGEHPGGKHAASYLDAMKNAANFAFANRLFLGKMAEEAIACATGRTLETRLVYDAPHNLVFEDGPSLLHRKGATPAGGPSCPDWLGQPVIIPGSMGAASWLCAGSGHFAALESACHGAGRSVPRGEAVHRGDPRALARLRVVTPLDVDSPAVRLRRDILEKHEKRLFEEAPSAYKDIGPVIESVQDAGIARRVARLSPLLTVKG